MTDEGVIGGDGAPAVGEVRFGSLRRLTPISRTWGFDRGRPIDRYYIERFLERHARDIRGRVLEIGDAAYTRAFGGDRVTQSDVLHAREHRPDVTIVADLASAPHVPSDTFDCIILTQTLQLVYDVTAVLRTIHRILRPRGTVLASMPGITKVVHDEWGDDQWWAFTARSARLLFEEVFAAPNVDVETHGNVLAATAFLHGIAVEELRADELDHRDPHYEVVIAVRAVKR